MTRKVHPAAAVFPMLPPDELEALAADIEANGLLHPVVVDGKGAVIDGRNRLAACELVGVEPAYAVHDGDPVAYVLGANVARRHMSTGARAMATAVVLAAAGKRRDGRWARGALAIGESSDSGWSRAMADAGVVLDVTPEVAPAVIAGAVSLHAAHGDAVEARRRADSFDGRLARLPSELAARVRDGDLTLEGAEAEHRQRTENDERLRRELDDGRRQMAGTVRRAIAVLANPASAEWLPSYLAAIGPPIEQDERDLVLAAIPSLLEETP